MAHTYQEPGIALLEPVEPQSAGKTLQVRALLFYSGKHTDSEGKTKTYKPEHIEAMAAATNERLASGRRVKGFLDHYNPVTGQYEQQNVFGSISSPVEAKIIESPEDLPQPGLFDELEGETGLYGFVTLSGQDFIDAYQDGRIKELSAGIDPKGHFSGGKYKNAIYEISAVGFPALDGAALFSKHPVLEQFSLTLTDALRGIKSRKMRDQLWDVYHAFTEVIDDIVSASPEELGDRTVDQLKQQAVTDLTSAINVLLMVTPTNPAPNPIPLFKAPPMTDATDNQDPVISQYAQRIDALEQGNSERDATIHRLQQRETIFSRYTSLHNKARSLVSQRKLSPVFLKQNFGSVTTDDVIQTFAKDVTEQREDLTIAGLDRLEAQLDGFEQFAQPMFGKGVVQDEPLPDNRPGESKEDKEELETYAKNFVDKQDLGKVPAITYGARNGHRK